MKVTLGFATAASALALAACSNSGGTEPAGNSSSSTPPAAASTTATAPPATEPAIPDGVYRTRITKAAFVVDTDPATAGTWTLILKDGTYKLTCEWVDQDGDDCGHSDVGNATATVEVGTTAGDDTTLWFQYDQAMTEKDPNASPAEPTNEELPPYRVNFTVRGDTVLFDHLWVDPRNSRDQPDGPTVWDFQPWTKIG